MLAERHQFWSEWNPRSPPAGCFPLTLGRTLNSFFRRLAWSSATFVCRSYSSPAEIIRESSPKGPGFDKYASPYLSSPFLSHYSPLNLRCTPFLLVSIDFYHQAKTRAYLPPQPSETWSFGHRRAWRRAVSCASRYVPAGGHTPNRLGTTISHRKEDRERRGRGEIDR